MAPKKTAPAKDSKPAAKPAAAAPAAKPAAAPKPPAAAPAPKPAVAAANLGNGTDIFNIVVIISNTRLINIKPFFVSQ